MDEIDAYLDAQLKGEQEQVPRARRKYEDPGNRNRSRSTSKAGHEQRRSRSRSRERSRRNRASESRDRGGRDRRYRDRGRDTDRSRSRERRRGDYDRGNDRGGNRRDDSRERDYDRRYGERDNKKGRYERDGRDSRREVDILTKDQRTIFVGQLTVKVTESDLRSFFGRIGGVNDIIMIRDKNTGKHKGFAYVEMSNLDDIPNCLMVNDCIPDFQKFSILVRPSEAERNYVSVPTVPLISSFSSSNAASGGPSATGISTNIMKGEQPSAKLFIANIHSYIDEDSLIEVMRFYGPLEKCKLVAEVGRPVNYGFVNYAHTQSALLAMTALNGLDIGGKRMTVQYQKS